MTCNFRKLAVAFLALIVPASAVEDASRLQHMTFRYTPTEKAEAIMGFDFRFIYADGQIDKGAAERFSLFLKQNKIASGAIVFLNSPGGLVTEALALGRAIRNAGLNTNVEGAITEKEGQRAASVCYSACTLAFLGGVERQVWSPFFGVHQVSISTSMSAKEALELGQVSAGEISEYAAYMGAKPEFVYELTHVSPEQIKLLSSADLRNMNVTTPEFKTDWQIKTMDGSFYLLGTTETNGGVDKLVVYCNGGKPVLMFMFNTTGQYKQDALNYTTDYGFEFDKSHMDLIPEEVLERVKASGDAYVSATIALSPRILEQLRTTRELTFEMTTPSHVTYQGWTTDFASGRDQFFGYLQSCR